MKLNNHGWCMRDMIIYTCILLLFLLFAAYSVSSLYDVINNDTTNVFEDSGQYVDDSLEDKEDKEDKEEPIILDLQYYNDLENKIKEATLTYLKTYPTDLSNDILKVNLDTLINLDFMDEIYDQTNTNKCTGYTNVYQDSDGDYVVMPYVNCFNYITEGY